AFTAFFLGRLLFSTNFSKARNNTKIHAQPLDIIFYSSVGYLEITAKFVHFFLGFFSIDNLNDAIKTGQKIFDKHKQTAKERILKFLCIRSRVRLLVLS